MNMDIPDIISGMPDTSSEYPDNESGHTRHNIWYDHIQYLDTQILYLEFQDSISSTQQILTQAATTKIMNLNIPGIIFGITRFNI